MIFQATNNLSKDLRVYNKAQKEMLLDLVQQFCGTITCKIIAHNSYSITYKIVSHYDVNYYTFMRDFFDELKYMKEA